MACWKDTMVVMLRAVIDDLGDSPSYSDDRLQQILVVAARMVDLSVDFEYEYTINVGTVEISPDPGDDNNFSVLVVLKAACMMARAEQKAKANRAITFKDGPSNIDGRPASEGTAKWSDTICKDYENALLQHKLGNLQPGKGIISPYRFDNSEFQPGISPRSRDTGSYFS